MSFLSRDEYERNNFGYYMNVTVDFFTKSKINDQLKKYEALSD